MGFLKNFSSGGLGPGLGSLASSRTAQSPGLGGELQAFGQGSLQLVTPEQLELFRLRYPMDEKAFDYLKISCPEVQERVVNTFRPPDNAQHQTDFSRIVTSHIKFCTRAHQDDSRHHHRQDAANMVSVEEACNVLMGRTPDGAGKNSVPEENLEMFRSNYPMDDRAFDYLKGSPADVQERVITTFRVDTAQPDYSRAVTAHVRFCLKRHRESASAFVPLPSGTDATAAMAMLADFKAQYPMDERALNYIMTSSVEVKSRVLSEFRPPPSVDGDFSKAITAFVRRCRDEEFKTWGGGGSYGGGDGYDSSGGHGLGGGGPRRGGIGYSGGGGGGAAPAARGGSSSSAAALLGAMGLSAEQQAQAEALLRNALAGGSTSGGGGGCSTGGGGLGGGGCGRLSGGGGGGGGGGRNSSLEGFGGSFGGGEPKRFRAAAPSPASSGRGGVQSVFGTASTPAAGQSGGQPIRLRPHGLPLA